MSVPFASWARFSTADSWAAEFGRKDRGEETEGVARRADGDARELGKDNAIRGSERGRAAVAKCAVFTIPSAVRNSHQPLGR